MDCAISELCYRHDKGTILQKNYLKMTILWSFSNNYFVKLHGQKKIGPHNMTMLYAIVSMNKKCHNHTLQTNPWDHQKEAMNDNRNLTFRIPHDCKTIKDTKFIYL